MKKEQTGEGAAVAAPSSETGFATAGERLLGRELHKETRHGVAHFVPGQYEAKTFGFGRDYETGDEHEIARLTYVDTMGHACVVTCIRLRDGGWKPTWVSRAGQFTEEPATRAPVAFLLSEKMLHALAAAPTTTTATQSSPAVSGSVAGGLEEASSLDALAGEEAT